MVSRLGGPIVTAGRIAMLPRQSGDVGSRRNAVPSQAFAGRHGAGLIFDGRAVNRRTQAVRP